MGTGSLRRRRPRHEKSLEKLLAGVPAKTGKGDQYGLGVQIRMSPGASRSGHGGWFPGYLSEMEYFPATRWPWRCSSIPMTCARWGRTRDSSSPKLPVRSWRTIPKQP